MKFEFLFDCEDNGIGLGSDQNLPEKPPGSRVGGPTGFSHRSLGGASAFLGSRFRGGINILCDLFWGAQ